MMIVTEIFLENTHHHATPFRLAVAQPINLVDSESAIDSLVSLVLIHCIPGWADSVARAENLRAHPQGHWRQRCKVFMQAQRRSSRPVRIVPLVHAPWPRARCLCESDERGSKRVKEAVSFGRFFPLDSWTRRRSSASLMPTPAQSTKHRRVGGLWFDTNQRLTQTAGIRTLADLLSISSSELQRRTKMSLNDAAALRTSAAEAIFRSRPSTALDLRVSTDFASKLTVLTTSRTAQGKQLRLSVGCDVLDEELRGGLLCPGITEVFGASGSGKTQFCLQMSLAAQLPLDKGGLGGSEFREQSMHMINYSW